MMTMTTATTTTTTITTITTATTTVRRLFAKLCRRRRRPGRRAARVRGRPSTRLAIGEWPAVARFHATGGAETIRDGAGVPAALRVPDARCGRRRVRLRVRGGPGDASRRVPAMWARGGPTASVWQEAATARAAGGAVRAPEREALRRPGRPAAVRDVRGRAATMNQESGGVAGQGAWQASLPALWRVKRAPTPRVSSSPVGIAGVRLPTSAHEPPGADRGQRPWHTMEQIAQPSTCGK